MEKNNKYLSGKAGKKKQAIKGVWFLLILAVIFIFVILRYAHVVGSSVGERRGPEKEDAYKIAKAYVLDDTRSEDIDFPDDGFSYAKKGDSVYVVKSTFEQRLGDGDKKVSNFSVVLRFRGGVPDDKNSWDLLNITKD